MISIKDLEKIMGIFKQCAPPQTSASKKTQDSTEVIEKPKKIKKYIDDASDYDPNDLIEDKTPKEPIVSMKDKIELSKQVKENVFDPQFFVPKVPHSNKYSYAFE